MTFYKKLSAAMRMNHSLLSIGLDSDLEKLPDTFKNGVHPQFTFNKAIIEKTHDLVCAYKPNSAFYEAGGVRGIQDLKKTCDFIRHKYPELVLIVDAKRADIGNTNKGYVSFIFDYLGADAVTLHPYLGRDAIQPFLDRKEKGCIILCRTSNPGAGEFQDTMYKTVARHVAEDWNKNKNCALVVGATYPGELKIVRRIVNSLPLLIPGIGAQGGDVEKTVRSGVDKHGAGIIVNASRSILFAQDPRDEARKLRDAINTFR